MKNFFKNKFFYIMTVIALLVTIVPTVFCNMGLTFVFRDMVGMVLTPMQKVFNYGAEAIDGFTSYFYKFDEIVEENVALKERVAELEAQIYDARELEDAYAWLSEFLDLKVQHTDFEMTPATVTGRESGNYSSVLTLDVGSGAGIERNMRRKRFLLRSYLAFLPRTPGNSAVWYCSILMVALNLSTVTLPPFCANFTERTS